MKTNYHEDYRYKEAKKRINDIKGFYVHLVVYIFVNTAIIVVNTQLFKVGFEKVTLSAFTTAFLWGIGLFAHWAGVFGSGLVFGKKWEERKINELMKKNALKKQKWE